MSSIADIPVLYLGDTSLDAAAIYLAGVMSRAGIGYEYFRSDQPLPLETAQRPWRLMILSDYPARLLSGAVQEELLRQVQAGCGLLMIGGWESYCGQGGDWAGHLLAQALPVTIAAADDRINFDGPAALLRRGMHPVTDGLPWEDRPPLVGGFNRIHPRPSAQVILEVQRFSLRRNQDFVFTLLDTLPMLAVGTCGAGRTAALATDLAPHWIGPMVDWGPQRVTAAVEGHGGIEVGDCYARFVENMLRWTGDL